MTHVDVCKADPIADEVIEDCHIHITQSLVHGGASVKKHDAEQLADALYASLPGGTLDLLVVELLRRKASQLRVAYGDET